jgi:hypothetical protein
MGINVKGAYHSIIVPFSFSPLFTVYRVLLFTTAVGSAIELFIDLIGIVTRIGFLTSI